MAKVKEQTNAKSKDSGESETAKSSKQPAAKTSHLSAEYVADSEDEDAPVEDRGIKKVVTQRVHGGEDDFEESSEENEDETSEEESEESGSEEEILPARRPNKTAVKVNGVKRSSTEAGSSEEEESFDESSDEREATEPAVKKLKTTVTATSRQIGANGAPSGRSRQPVEQRVLAAKPFEVPAGYDALDLSSAAGSSTVTSSSLSGKVLWHIVAPADLPIAELQEVDMAAVQSGKPVLSYKGANYVLGEAAGQNEHTACFLPEGGAFRPMQHQQIQTFHLQQKIDLPNVSSKQASQLTGSDAAAVVAQAPIKAIRPQPKGLRMRFKPPGAGSGDPAWSDSDEDDGVEQAKPTQRPELQFPKALGAHGSSERTAKPGGAQHGADEPKKKAKKMRRDRIQDSAPSDQRAVSTNGAEKTHVGGSSATAAASAAKKVVAPQDGDIIMVDSLPEPKLSKEEKAKRKEEKRLKKQAKQRV